MYDEYSGDSTQLLYLRSRFYASNTGRFLTRDTWGGNYNRPLSLNRWMYVEGNPTNRVDPSGYFPEFCQSMPTKGFYEYCVLKYYGLEPISLFQMGKTVSGEQGCYSGPSEYRAPGYLEGLGIWVFAGRGGREVVYDFARMEKQTFDFGGGGFNDSIDIGIGAQGYIGLVQGFRTDESLSSQYRGISFSGQLGASGGALGFGGGGGIGGFYSWTDPMLNGMYIYVGGSFSLDLLPIVDVDVTPVMFYIPNENTRESYVSSSGLVNTGSLVSDILSGDYSPLTIRINVNGSPIAIDNNHVSMLRLGAVAVALHHAMVYEELRKSSR